MARGQQKLQSQAKAAERAAKMKKQQGHSATDQKKAAQKALVHVCAVCKVNSHSHYLFYLIFCLAMQLRCIYCTFFYRISNKMA